MQITFKRSFHHGETYAKAGQTLDLSPAVADLAVALGAAVPFVPPAPSVDTKKPAKK